jgi:hypothetical protein
MSSLKLWSNGLLGCCCWYLFTGSCSADGGYADALILTILLVLMHCSNCCCAAAATNETCFASGAFQHSLLFLIQRMAALLCLHVHLLVLQLPAVVDFVWDKIVIEIAFKPKQSA